MFFIPIVGRVALMILGGALLGASGSMLYKKLTAKDIEKEVKEATKDIQVDGLGYMIKKRKEDGKVIDVGIYNNNHEMFEKIEMSAEELSDDIVYNEMIYI